MTQPQQKPYLTYALDADSKLIHIDSVSTGLACKCFCPHCKSELVAKNGEAVRFITLRTLTEVIVSEQ